MILAVALKPDPRATIIQSMLDRNRLSFRWLADRISSNHMSVARWVKGEVKPHNDKVYQSMINVLAEYEKDIANAGEVPVRKVGMRTIPLYTSISAGSPMTFTGDIEPLDVPDLKTGNEQWARVVNGMSMFPLLEPGDIVVFEDRPAEPNHVVHAFDAGEDTIKVFRKSGSKVELVPVNPDFETIDARKFNVKGVAVMRIRKGPHGEKTTTEYPHGMRYLFTA